MSTLSFFFDNLSFSGNHESFLIFFVSGYFALLPWSIPFLFGMLLGYCFIKDVKIFHIIKYLFFASFILYLTGFWLSMFHGHIFMGYNLFLEITKNPPSLPYLLEYTGISFLILSVFLYIFDYKNYRPFPTKFIEVFSQRSLSLFCIHYALGLVVICKGLGHFTNNPVYAIISSLIFFYIFGFFCKLVWEEHNYKFSLEYFLNNFVKAITQR